MRRQTALLVETGFANGNSIKAVLRDILAPDFRLEVLVQTARVSESLSPIFMIPSAIPISFAALGRRL